MPRSAKCIPKCAILANRLLVIKLSKKGEMMRIASIDDVWLRKSRRQKRGACCVKAEAGKIGEVGNAECG